MWHLGFSFSVIWRRRVLTLCCVDEGYQLFDYQLTVRYFKYMVCAQLLRYGCVTFEMKWHFMSKSFLISPLLTGCMDFKNLPYAASNRTAEPNTQVPTTSRCAARRTRCGRAVPRARRSFTVTRSSFILIFSAKTMFRVYLRTCTAQIHIELCLKWIFLFNRAYSLIVSPKGCQILFVTSSNRWWHDTTPLKKPCPNT